MKNLKVSMYVINKKLSIFANKCLAALFELQLTRVTGKFPEQFKKNYLKNLQALRKDPRGFKIYKEPRYDAGLHNADCRDFECGFAAKHINRLNPKNIMDIGSYRLFILGLLAGYKVTTLDVRDREAVFSKEVVITSDAKKLNLPDNYFDVVVSLCAVEHFGLGRYGDDFDLAADYNAFKEMVRVLKPNGRLIFSTTITRAEPAISFNAHRIYNHDMIKTLCVDLTCEEETYYIYRTGIFGSLAEVTLEPNAYDIYCGCWKKNNQGA